MQMASSRHIGQFSHVFSDVEERDWSLMGLFVSDVFVAGLSCQGSLDRLPDIAHVGHDLVEAVAPGILCLDLECLWPQILLLGSGKGCVR